MSEYDPTAGRSPDPPSDPDRIAALRESLAFACGERDTLRGTVARLRAALARVEARADAARRTGRYVDMEAALEEIAEAAREARNG